MFQLYEKQQKNANIEIIKQLNQFKRTIDRRKIFNDN